MAMDDKSKALSEERSQFYGDPHTSHTAIGLAWRAILMNHFQELHIPPIPARLVALMMSVFKEVRAARPKLRADSYDDAHVYLNYAEDWHKEIPEMSLHPSPAQSPERGVYAKGLSPVERRRKSDVTLPDALDGDLGLNITVAQDDVMREIVRVADTKVTMLHPLTKHYTILGEEFGEVGRAVLSFMKGEGPEVRANLYDELVQVAATATVMAARIKGGAV